MSKTNHRPLNFKEFDAVLSYDGKSGDIRYKVDCGRWGGHKAGEIATYEGCLDYLLVSLNNKTYGAQRIAWLLYYKKDPGDLEIDHLNRNKSDNRICNLEAVTKTEHKKRQPMRKDCKSGVTGVCWNKFEQVWNAYINVDGKPKILGRFKRKADAVRCRKAAEKEHGYHRFVGKTNEQVQEMINKDER